MNDRELLELAAKAAGIDGEWCEFTLHPSGEVVYGIGNSMVFTPGVTRLWNPLEDDGDALRLAVSLSLVINNRHRRSLVEHMDGSQFWQEHEGDELAATRRAIVFAAAEIGKAVP